MIKREGVAPVIAVALIIAVICSPLVNAEERVYIWGEASVPALAVAQLPNGTTIGSVGEIKVRVLYPGEGKVYVNTEPLSDIDMQASVRAAVMIASYYARVNPLDFDFLVSIITESPLVGGPSAGSAMVAAIYSALTHKPINPRVAATGMILPDGLVGPVGGIPYKVEAAIRKGYDTVLIPLGQSIYSETTYQTQVVGSVVVTRPVTITWNVTDLALKLGGKAVESSTAVDVIEKFTGEFPLKEVYGRPSLTDKEMELTRSEYHSFLNQSSQLREQVQSKVREITSRTYRASVQNMIQSSESFYSQAIDAWDNGYYYAGLSFAFVSTYQAMMAKYLTDSLTSGDPGSYLRSVYNDLRSSLDRYKARYVEALNETQSYTLDSLFLLSEISSRIRDAERSLALSDDALQKGDWGAASTNLGYVWGRLRSLDYWFSLLGLASPSASSPIQVERLSSWILSYSYSSASYVDALQSSTGRQLYDTSGWYDMLRLASSLITAGDYPGALDLSIELLVSSSIALQSLFSLDIAKTVDVLSVHSRLILGNSEYAPISARLYLMMADLFSSQQDFESSLSYYERALIILYASSMTALKQGGEVTLTPAQNRTASEPIPTEVAETTGTPSQTNESNTTTSAVLQTETPQQSFGARDLYQYIVVSALVLVALVLLTRVLRRSET